MNIVVDTNIVLSAVLKDGITRRTILSSPHTLLLPVIALTEIENHKYDLLERYGLDGSIFQKTIELLIEKMTLVRAEKYNHQGHNASEILSSIDPDDVPFIACALAFPGSIIWSEDKRLKRQITVPVLNTEEILRIEN